MVERNGVGEEGGKQEKSGVMERLRDDLHTMIVVRIVGLSYWHVVYHY